MKAEIFLLQGSNKGDRKKYLEDSRDLINKNLGTILQISSFYKSAPWQMKSENEFLNRVLKLETDLSPIALLYKIFEIEKKLGRDKKSIHENYKDREIDLDILFYENLIFESLELVIPHPKLHLRRFTLVPLGELAPDKKHPVLKKSVKKLLEECEDDLKVDKVNFF